MNIFRGGLQSPRGGLKNTMSKTQKLILIVGYMGFSFMYFPTFAFVTGCIAVDLHKVHV